MNRRGFLWRRLKSVSGVALTTDYTGDHAAVISERSEESLLPCPRRQEFVYHLCGILCLEELQ